MIDLAPARRALLAALGGLLAAAGLAIALPAAAAPTFQDQVMEQVNVERWNNGQLPPLKRNSLLDNAAGTHVQNMAGRDFFAHCDLDTRTSPWDRMNAAGYTGWNSGGENIAAGYTTPAAVMSGWMNSSGHRANILGTTFRELGIGYTYQSTDQRNVRLDPNSDCISDSNTNGPYLHYWAQDFGRIGAVYPVIINREAYQTVNATVSLYVYGAGWAQQMRFRNEAGAWSAWQAYATDVSWALSPGNGVKTVTCEIKSGVTVYSNSDEIVLDASADLVLTMSDSPDPATAGADLTYRVIVTNAGTSTATSVLLSDPLPAGVSFLSCDRGGSVAGGTLTCGLGTLLPSATDTVHIVVRPAGAGTLMNTASVTAGEFDPAPANNSAATTTTVEASPTAVGDEPPVARVLTLRPASPNPFARVTRLAWYQPAAGRVLLTIHDVAGRRVATLIDAGEAAGEHALLWDGQDQGGRRLGAGVYFGRIEVGGRIQSVKILLTR